MLKEIFAQATKRNIVQLCSGCFPPLIMYHHLLSFIEKLNKYYLKEEYSIEFSLIVTFNGMEACPRNSSTPK